MPNSDANNKPPQPPQPGQTTTGSAGSGTASSPPAPISDGQEAILAAAPVLLQWVSCKTEFFQIMLPGRWISQYKGPRRGNYLFQPVEIAEFPHLAISPLPATAPKATRKRAIKCTWPPREPGSDPERAPRIRAPAEGPFLGFVLEHWMPERAGSRDLRIPVKVLALLYPDDVVILVRNESVTSERTLMPPGAVEGYRDNASGHS